MDLKALNERMASMQQELQQGLAADLPRIVGVEAVNHFKDGFENEGFTDVTLVKWDEVKRRMGKGKGAAAQRKILTGETGNLKDSIDYDAEPRKTVVYANPQNKGAKANYAVPHNFGASDAGRSRNVTIPKRQFIGKSEVLEGNIKSKITSWLQLKIKSILK